MDGELNMSFSAFFTTENKSDALACLNASEFNYVPEYVLILLKSIVSNYSGEGSIKIEVSGHIDPVYSSSVTIKVEQLCFKKPKSVEQLSEGNSAQE
jgi:hypothetical protein